MSPKIARCVFCISTAELPNEDKDVVCLKNRREDYKYNIYIMPMHNARADESDSCATLYNHSQVLLNKFRTINGSSMLSNPDTFYGISPGKTTKISQKCPTIFIF